MKSRNGKSQRREEKRRRKKIKRESLRRKKIQVPEKVGKSRNTVFFRMVCGSGGTKSRLAKAAGAEPAGQMRDEELHALVARSAFPSQKCKKLTGLEHLLHYNYNCNYNYHYITLHYTYYTTVPYTTLHCTTLHCTTHTTLHYIALHYTLH